MEKGKLMLDSLMAFVGEAKAPPCAPVMAKLGATAAIGDMAATLPDEAWRQKMVMVLSAHLLTSAADAAALEEACSGCYLAKKCICIHGGKAPKAKQVVLPTFVKVLELTAGMPQCTAMRCFGSAAAVLTDLADCGVLDQPRQHQLDSALEELHKAHIKMADGCENQTEVCGRCRFAQSCGSVNAAQVRSASAGGN